MWHSSGAKGWDHAEATEEARSQSLLTPWWNTEVASSRASLGQLDVPSLCFLSLPPLLPNSLPPLVPSCHYPLSEAEPYIFMEILLIFFLNKNAST